MQRVANENNGVSYNTHSSHLAKTIAMIREHKTLNGKLKVDGNHLTIAQVHAVAKTGYRHVTVAEECWKTVEDNVDYLQGKLESGSVIYGINTGFGGSADVRCFDTKVVQDSLIRHLNAGFGEIFNSSVPRGMMLIRVNSLCRGMSGVRPEVLQLLCDMIREDVIPVVPKRGSVSASGDLMPSSYVAAAMMGRPESKVHYKETMMPARQALKEAKLNAIEFIDKDALAIVNSCSFAVSLGSQLMYPANRAAVLTQVAVVMTAEALIGRTESFHPTIHKCMPHPYQIEAAENIFDMLKDTKLAKTMLDMEGADQDGILKQDRYGLRTAAQWLGPALEQLQRATATVNIDLNSTNDNPVIDHLKDTILHGGNFQGTAMAVAMDNTRQALQLCGKLLFAQMSEVINVKMSNGLPPNLSGCDYSKDFGFKGTDTAMASYMSELDMLTNQVTSHVLSAEMNNQSVNSLALISARWTEQALTVLHQMLANISVCQAQAIDLRWLKGQVTQVLRQCWENCSPVRIHPETWQWYDFAFKPTAWESFIETVPELESKRCIIDEARAVVAEMVETVNTGKHVNRVAECLGNGARMMYLYIRQSLDIEFYRGERSLDTDLQKMLSAITDGDIETLLLDLFNDAYIS